MYSVRNSFSIVSMIVPFGPGYRYRYRYISISYDYPCAIFMKVTTLDYIFNNSYAMTIHCAIYEVATSPFPVALVAILKLPALGWVLDWIGLDWTE